MLRFIYLALWLFCSPFVLLSQIKYDFESGSLDEWIQKPAGVPNPWEASDNSPISGARSLRHSRSGVARTDTIFIPVTGITFEEHDVTWKFLLKHTYNPSGTNKWAVFLAANNMSSKLNGYAIGVNMRTASTNDDLLCLYEVNEGSYVNIIDTKINWETSVTINNVVALEIRRNHNGYWRIDIDIGGDFSNITFCCTDSIYNDKYSDISYFGILHTFTASANAALSLFIDDISIEAIDRSIPKAFDTEIIPPDNQVSGKNIPSINKDMIEVFRFGIQDIADSDNLPTYLRQVTVKNTGPPFCASWKTVIKNAYLYAENLENPQVTNTIITDDSIVFLLNDNLLIPSGDIVDLAMKIVLNDSLADNSTLQFKIDKKNHGFISATNGSGMIAELTDDIVSNTFTVEVEADTIFWKNVPNTVPVHSYFSITAIATDNKGNIDKDFSYPADMILNSGNGNLNVGSLTFVNGELNVENVSYNKAENIAIQLSSASLTSANHYVSVILDRNSSIKNPSEQILGTTIISDAVSIESEVPVFRFVIKDSTGDGAATYVNELKFTNPLSQANWNNIIGGISLYNGEQRLITNIIDQAKDYIRVGLFPGSLTIADGAEKELILKIWLKTKVSDKTKLVFMIPATNHGCQAAQNGSLFADDFIQNIVSDTFDVEVNATKIIFSKNAPATIAPNSPFSLEINAVNNDGTIDFDATEEITLELATEGGNLNSVSSELTKQLVEGKVAWNDLTIDTHIIFRIKAKHPYFGEILSSEIASMDLDSEVLPVLSQQKSIFKSTDTLISDAKEVIRFQISDKGTNDRLPTIVNKMVFGTISEMYIPDLIGGIELLSGSQNISLSFTSTENQITVIPNDLNIPDGESREIILKIFFKRAKCVDGSKLQLYIPATTHGWTVTQNSSQLLKTFEYPIYSEVHSVDIEASRIMILSQPMIVLKNTPFSFNVGATDYIGNVDISFTNSISILKSEGAGKLQNLSATQLAGIYTFSAIYDSLEDFSFKTVNEDMPDVLSMPIYSANHIDTIIKSGISTWNNTGDWIWNGNKLKHNSGDGLSYVSVPVDINLTKKVVQWDFTIENGNFDPSADNAFWCVLSSDDDDLGTENLSGYVIGVNYTGSSDLVSFWKVKASTKQLLWSSSYDWNANMSMRIIVQKTENEWKIFIKEKEQPISLAGKFSDNELLPYSKFSGFVFKYTSSRNGMFSINNYEVITTNPPFKVSKAEIIDKSNIKINFSSNLIFPDALNLDNYLLNSISNAFEIFDVDKITDNEVKLSTQLLSDTLFLLSISRITDIYVATIKDTVIKLRRITSEAKCSLAALSRNLLELEFKQDMIDSTIINTSNYLLTNVTGDIFSINNVTKNSGKIYLECDSLQGNAFTLYYSNLETEDGFLLSDSVILNKSYLPAKINKAEATSLSTVIVEFSKNIQEAGNYLIKHSRGTVFDVASKIINNKQVTLTLSEALSGNSFMLYISETKDNEGFTIIDSTYFRYQTVNFGDLVFNEIMAKPNPPASLPNREYLELYNRTADTIYLTDFRILYGAGKSSRITSGKIAPHGYAIICASSSVSDLSVYGEAFSATSFPSLLDAGMMLTLTSPDNTVIAVVEYNNSFYGDDTKSKGGWSLERIDPENLSDNGNWKGSINANGGTPGKENSVLGINPDNTAPYVEKTEFSGNFGLIVYFSERINKNVLSVFENYSISGLSITTINLEDDEYLNSVELICSETFELDKVYELNISGISDIVGNIISDTIIYVFIDAPKITDSKIVSSTELQITFSESMIVSDVQNVLNYKLLSSSNSQLTILGLNLETTKRKDLSIRTEVLRDSLLKLEVKNLKDSRGYLLKDTVIEFYRTRPQLDFKLESANRTLLSLTFNINMIDSTILNAANYKLINDKGVVFAINEVRKNTSKRIYLDCDSLQGNAFTLYYSNLETEAGFLLSDSVILNKSYLPAKINKAEATSLSTVIVEFSKNIQEAGNYLIKNSQGIVFDVTSKTISSKQVTLNLSKKLFGNNFSLHIDEAKDNEGFTITNSTYFRYQTVSFGNLVFNEIMAKPNPPVSLPDREYLELYNRTTDTIYLTNFCILYGAGKSARITTGKIAPHKYAIICASSSASEFYDYGDVFSATSFPSLLDAGMMLTLISPDSTVVAVVEYSNSFYENEAKSKGGWSLERIDSENLSDNGNWKVSNSADGGTPGRKNSVAETNPDNIQPYVLKTEMIDEYSIRILFSENIISSILENIEYYLVIRVGNPSKAKAANAELSNTVELTFDKSFNTGTIYELAISPNINDIHRNEYTGDPIFFGQMYKPEKGSIVINEILFHPRSGGSDFVEIYNRSDRILDLSDISIASRNRTTGNLQQIHRVSEIPIYVQPADYFVFTTDLISLQQAYYIENPANVVIMSGFPTYPNEDGTVVLLDNEDNIIDEFSYSANMHGIFVSNPEGVSLERVDFERKSSELGNWQSAAQTVGFATPTYKNSCYTHTTKEVNETFTLMSTTFSPDGDGYEEVLFIDYKMPGAGFIVNIRIYNIRGQFVKEICRNVALGVEGRLVWDGSKANNTKAPVGPYILLIEAFDANGRIYKYKKICVVASRKK
ncbi:MAG: lamin tail domain-containing protein [Prevotellaceae bacterium]|jgi:hypothetical protein|nr:lamin tail domain-containing protein [Prevotellaceae bacterium]